MNKKVLILSGSPRKGGNSDILCDKFMRGTKESGNEVEKMRIGKENWLLQRLLLLQDKRRRVCNQGRYGRGSAKMEQIFQFAS